MIPAIIFQLEKSKIEWYFTEAVEAGEQVYFYRDEQAERDSNNSSVIVVDVIKETDDYFYVIIED